MTHQQRLTLRTNSQQHVTQQQLLTIYSVILFIHTMLTHQQRLTLRTNSQQQHVTQQQLLTLRSTLACDTTAAFDPAHI